LPRLQARFTGDRTYLGRVHRHIQQRRVLLDHHEVHLLGDVSVTVDLELKTECNNVNNVFFLSLIVTTKLNSVVQIQVSDK
jgi:hypothetical protein